MIRNNNINNINSIVKSTIVENNYLKDLFYNYLKYWKLFTTSLIFFIICAVVYLRYQVPRYEAKASILIKDEKKGSGLNELSAFQDLGIFNNSNNIDNEIEILKSRNLMENVVNDLTLNLEYFTNTGLFEKELYVNRPIFINCVLLDSCLTNLDTNFIISVIDKNNFKLVLSSKSDESKIYHYGDTLNFGFAKMLIQCNNNIDKYYATNIKVKFSPVNKSIDRYQNALQINAINKTSNVIQLSLKDQNREKAVSIITNIIKQRNLDAIGDKNQISKNTAEFINERIDLITSELSEVENEAQSYKTKHKLVDAQSEASLFLTSGVENERLLVDTKTQMQIVDYMIDYANAHQSPRDLIPVNIGINDVNIAELINNFNKIVLERSKFDKSSGEKNPLIINLDLQISTLRQSLNESLNNLKSSLFIKYKDFSKQEKGINSKILEVPKYEKEYRVIYRQQQIKETLYLYLLQKREETNIALAIAVSDVKIIANAYSSDITVSPKRRVVYAIALLLSLIFPIGILYIKDLFDTKVKAKHDFEKLNAPYLGEVPICKFKNKLIVKDDNNSGIAEAFRLLRTNVDFMLNASSNNCRTVFITSTIEKEGKSFIALNLASSFAISGKRVLLLGLDLRAPKILQYLDMKDKIGISDFLADSELLLNDIILNAPDTKNLFILPSGTIPPNPAELLMTDRISVLFEQLKKQFDYIIVDTAPVGLVTDTLLVSKFADSFVFVIKANYLEKKMLTVVEDIFIENRLPNMGILLNGSENTAINLYGYGNRTYGYGKR